MSYESLRSMVDWKYFGMHVLYIVRLWFKCRVLDVVSAVQSCKNMSNAIQCIRSLSSAVLVISRLVIIL